MKISSPFTYGCSVPDGSIAPAALKALPDPNAFPSCPQSGSDALPRCLQLDTDAFPYRLQSDPIAFARYLQSDPVAFPSCPNPAQKWTCGNYYQ